MYCVSCGNALPDSAAFCPHCGKKQPSELVNQSSTAVGTETHAHIQAAKQELLWEKIDFPSEVEPISIYEKDKWMFRYKNETNPPPNWTKGSLNLMFSEEVFFILSADDLNASEWIKGIGLMASTVVVGLAAAAVPIAGVAAGLAALAAEKAIGRKKKHPGYGKKNQFKRDALLTAFVSGQAMWAYKSECDFRSLRSRVITSTTHYLAIVGKFYTATGVEELALFKIVGNANAKNDFANDNEITYSRDEKFGVLSEALNSIKGFPYPPITTENDDAWWK